jgi:hypothetical protein
MEHEKVRKIPSRESETYSAQMGGGGGGTVKKKVNKNNALRSTFSDVMYAVLDSLFSY